MNITGVWLRKDFAHLGNKVEVLIEREEEPGTWRLLTSQTSDEGMISHIFEEGAMAKAPKEE